MTNLKDIKGTFAIDPEHSLLGFSARHAMVSKVHGSFRSFEGTAKGSVADPANGKIFVTFRTDSIDTGNAKRDAHLRSADFFDSEQFPTGSFESTSIEVDDDELTVTGQLTLHGVTNPVTIPFEFGGAQVGPDGVLRIGFEGATTISRQQWGLTWNAALEAGGVMVKDKVKLEIEIEAVQQSEEY
ncbi:MAG: YceI family protein [Actinomycetaceae bacterium]|nr:YceI family protein [Actinomycetaceae bacterium]MDY6082317.1 YceI family protein [Actinomycetaceae bacterium]